MISKIHSTNISNGSELERIINQILANENRVIEDVDTIEDLTDNVYVIPKKVVKKSILSSKYEPDFMIMVIDGKKRHCHIIELKDGMTFDTKKSAAERINLIAFSNHISNKIPFTSSIHVCCFNQEDKDKIFVGFKGVFALKEILTGIEFCELLKIDYYKIFEMRKSDQEDNFNYFIEELMKIETVKNKISKRL